MILIITEEADYSSSLVIDWLLYFKIDFIRVNENDVLDIEYELNDIKIVGKSFSFFYSELKGMWYRRGFLNIKYEETKDLNINNFRKIEYVKLKEYLYYKLSLLPNINKYTNSDVNKLVVNEIAKKCELMLPDEYILNKKNEILKLDDDYEYATKSITGSTILNYEYVNIIGYTTKIRESESYPESFFPSLVQRYIDKKYELRIFYLHKKFYSMAIFSQKDQTTQIDFRNYNRKKPNRNVPFELPLVLKEKLIRLMGKLNLNSGSIDMICTPKNEFVFLEVNPIGQYGMVSNPCNYNLHKEIAQFFKNG